MCIICNYHNNKIAESLEKKTITGKDGEENSAIWQNIFTSSSKSDKWKCILLILHIFFFFSFLFLRVFITQVPRPPPNRQKVLYVNSCKSKVLFLDAKQLSIAETGLLNNLPLDLKSHTTSEMLMTVAVYSCTYCTPFLVHPLFSICVCCISAIAHKSSFIQSTFPLLFVYIVTSFVSLPWAVYSLLFSFHFPCFTLPHPCALWVRLQSWNSTPRWNPGPPCRSFGWHMWKPLNSFWLNSLTVSILVSFVLRVGMYMVINAVCA